MDRNALDLLELHLAEVDPDASTEAAVGFLREKDADFLWRLVIEAGERHTMETGEEHVIGDLEDALQVALQMLSPAQREQFIRAILEKNTVLEGVLADAGGGEA